MINAKHNILTLVAAGAALMMVAGGAMASDSVASHYFSAKNLTGHSLSSVNAVPPATDITVIDNAGMVTRVIIPNTPIDDTLFPNRPNNIDHIYNQNWGGNTEIVLTDANGNVFFDQSVWPHAVLNITLSNGQLYATQLSTMPPIK